MTLCRVSRRARLEALGLQARPQVVPMGRLRLAILHGSGWGGGLFLESNGLAFCAVCYW